ncbi:hypothetical protein OKW45_000460 [Paraburkholderia sp. WSM4175]
MRSTGEYPSFAVADVPADVWERRAAMGRRKDEARQAQRAKTTGERRRDISPSGRQPGIGQRPLDSPQPDHRHTGA